MAGFTLAAFNYDEPSWRSACRSICKWVWVFPSSWPISHLKKSYPNIDLDRNCRQFLLQPSNWIQCRPWSGEMRMRGSAGNRNLESSGVTVLSLGGLLKSSLSGRWAAIERTFLQTVECDSSTSELSMEEKWNISVPPPVVPAGLALSTSKSSHWNFCLQLLVWLRVCFSWRLRPSWFRWSCLSSLLSSAGPRSGLTKDLAVTECSSSAPADSKPCMDWDSLGGSQAAGNFWN